MTATVRVTDIVEAMHQTIGAGPEVLGRPLERVTKVLTAPTYRAIRGLTGVVGSALDLALLKLAPYLSASGFERNAVVAALNGVMGDTLAATDNALAIQMQLCAAGVPVESTQVQGKVVVLVHGSSMSDDQWFRKGHNHGLALARDLGLTPLFLRYNSGLHVSQNGRRLAELLEQLLQGGRVTELVLIGHSMGGLVARSALVHGELAGHQWRPLASTLITLGSPHHGSPVERVGHWVDVLLPVSRYSAPLAALGHLRSAGVTDLRYGNVIDAHWEHRDRFARGADSRTPVPLPKNVRCFAIAATTALEAGGDLPSDGLVPVDSALGRHPLRAELDLKFDDAKQWLVYGTTHLDLLSSQAVYRRLVEALTTNPS